MFAQRHPGKLSWCLALPSWHARGHDLALTDYPRPPSEAYLPERDAPLKPCQTISPGIYQSKSPLGRFHCVMQDVIPQRGDHSVRTVIIWHPVSGTLGKQTCLELTTQWKPSIVWSTGKPITIKHGKNSTWQSSTSNTVAWQGRWNNQHTARQFTRMRLWLQNGKFLVCKHGCTHDQWIVFCSTWDKFRLGGLAKVQRLLLYVVLNGKKAFQIYTSYISHEWLVRNFI